MFDIIVSHALKNVWCTPRQDKQVVIKPARLTPYGGAANQFTVLWRKVALPETSARFHVYQIGQLPPGMLGLLDAGSTWTTLAQACNSKKLMSDVYNDFGVQMPRTQVWYKVTEDRDLILAVKYQPTITGFDFNNDALYLRVYSNAYFTGSEADANADYISVQGGIMADAAAVLALQTAQNTKAALTGAVTSYVNGMRVDAITLTNTHAGDVAEFVYDSTVYKVIDLPISGLRTFQSELDSKFKYLLHYVGSAARGIDFHDDMDVFLVKPASGHFSGVYLHRNTVDAVRMVTHKDYSVPVNLVNNLAAARTGWEDSNTLTLRLQIRKANAARGLISENNRIKELYKLSDSDLLAAMTGLNAVVPVWTASNLEKSAYAFLMRADISQVNRALVDDAYGYNAISKLLADTPVATYVSSGNQVADTPYGLTYNSTAYEYDTNGLLLGWYPNTAGVQYTAANSAVRIVEMISGQVNQRIDDTFGEREQILDPAAEYRMYTCPIIAGVPSNTFTDVTGTSQYAIVGDTLTWLTDPDTIYTMVRSNKTSLGYSTSLPFSGGALRFTLMQNQLRNNAINAWPMQVPMGELDVFLNGHSLIEGVDYFVKFPQIFIVNKQYLVNASSQNQNVAVRFSGFCKPDFTREAIEDVGFVEYGLISHNSHYNLHGDKVMRIIVGGRIYRSQDILFSETDAAIVVPDAKNGLPYQVRDIVVPLRGYAGADTYALRTISKGIDAQVSNYLTIKNPEVVQTGPNVIDHRHLLYSPFCSMLIAALQSGAFDSDQRLYKHYNDDVVNELCQPYVGYLAFDPCTTDNAPDVRYTLVHPHYLSTAVSLSVYRYSFLLRAVKLFLKNALVLTDYVTISG